MKKINIRWIPVICVVMTFMAAGTLLWVNSRVAVQSEGIIYPRVIFQGEYKMGDGPWQEYCPGMHLSAAKEDITLKGTLNLQLPETGEDVGSVSAGNTICMYCDHLGVRIQEEGYEPVFLEVEIPGYEITCTKVWQYYTYQGEPGKEMEIQIHRPHKFGNQNAVDELLNNMYIYAGYDFEEDRIKEGSLQRTIGMVVLLSACCMLGISVFAARIHIWGNRILQAASLLIAFAGGYIVLSSPYVNLWNPAYNFNTIVLGICMMMYQFLMTLLMTKVLGKKTKKAAHILVCLSGGLPTLLLMVSIVTDIHFYATWEVWMWAEAVVCLVLLFCLFFDWKKTDKCNGWLKAACMLPLSSFLLDTAATKLGWWQQGSASMLVFYLLFMAAFVIVVRIIPEKINEAARAKELEEKQRELQQELKDRRVSVMMSQIRTHFIFNVMTMISGLCNIDPLKADDALILFARYLRRNIGIMDRDEPILFSKELEHLEDYVSLERMRFGDKIKFEKEIQTVDFKIPPLTLQPLVENAIKHGLLEHGKQGTIRLLTREEEKSVRIIVEDNGAGFLPEALKQPNAVGIRNVRYRIENMVGGTIEITSVPEQGTKVEIQLFRK